MKETQINGESLDIVSENVSKLKELFPEIVTEDKIDFDKLKEVLGKYTEEDNERYNFTWKGKANALRLAQTPSTGTLRPCKEESKNWDTTENLYIEGDNLEVLKLLQKSYYGKIKMIYIDPPYNTGKDFVYRDNYKDNLHKYLEMTGQIDNEGIKISTNTDTDGRYHTNWVNMMYPRLRLARNLLKDDGVIFVSIDDNELDNLKKICNEIFGEENFVSIITWQKKTQPSFLSKEISNIKEYIIFYRKSSKKVITKGGLTDKNKLIELINISNSRNTRILKKENVIIKNTSFKGLIKKGNYGNGKLEIELLNDITVDKGAPKENLKLNGRFKWTQETMNQSFEDGDIYYIKNINTLRPTVERANKVAKIKPMLDLLSKKLNQDIPTNTDATNELKNLFDGITPMDYPKPSKLIRFLIDAITFNDKNCYILDFFSGSATTADATMQLNSIDGDTRKFILIQLEEPIPVNENNIYNNVSEIGKERIRRAGDKIKSNNKDLDIGFKVFKLDSSNLNKWNPDYNNLEQSLIDTTNNLVEGRTELDLVYEIMLKYGIDLTLPIEEFDIANKKVYSIGFGSLLICLDDNITNEIAIPLVEKIKELSPEIVRVVFKDNGFSSDSDKTNIKETLKTHRIDDFVTI